MKKYIRYKRILDIIFSLIGLLVLSPVFLLIIIAIMIESKGNVLFKQKRIGKNKVYFNILKFRTMRIDTPKDVPTHLLKTPEAFITKTGKFLRKTSLDELPQLINILKGDMSFIGPRPALWNQYDLIDARESLGVNNIFPGLSGWAQVNGRDELPIDVKAELDGVYVKKMSLFFDIKCLIRTLLIILTGRGNNEGTSEDIR